MVEVAGGRPVVRLLGALFRPNVIWTLGYGFFVRCRRGRQRYLTQKTKIAATISRTYAMTIHLRKATREDIPGLKEIIDASVRGLQANDYSPTQIEAALNSVYGVDTQLIADETYLVAEINSEIVACGGWSKRKTLYGGDQYKSREDTLLNPATDAAKIRAFFVRPQWARKGIGAAILKACEEAAREAGFTRLEMGATLSGIPFYKAKGYEAVENQEVPLSNGETLPIVKMQKNLP
jgi:N-acetylglutamate synthase-like GNAT family acetyltransferase